jgi:signal transduction histidine kinase
MKIDAAARVWQPLPLAKQAGQLRTFVAHIPQRLHSRQFWQVQGLVAGVTMLHYSIEVLGFTSPAGIFHDVAITLYIVPLVYASLTFGWEGALMTALWGVVLTSPSTWVWHHSEEHWLTEVFQLVVAVFVGMLVAWRVQRERQERLRAERTSASLNLLKAVSEGLSHTLEVEERLPVVLHQLRSGLPLRSISLCLEPATTGAEPLIIEEGDGASSPGAQAQTDDVAASATRGDAAGDWCTVSIPLVGESGMLGMLTATADSGDVLAEDRVELLTTAAREISVAVQNTRLYRQRQEDLESYVRQVTQAQEEERLRIARELHDDTAQELVHLVRQLEELELHAGGVCKRPAQESLETAHNILRSVRRFSRDLRPSVLDDLGLLAAIEMVVEDAHGHLVGGAHLHITGDPRRLSPRLELALFRIAQEALRNILKHANATTATVELCFCDNVTGLTITDDGNGFLPPANLADLVRHGKLGLIGMKERAESIGGSFMLRRNPEQGMGLMVEVPNG